jgi:hypothetical protein
MAGRCAKLATMVIRARLAAASTRRMDGNRRFGLLLILLAGTYVISAFVPGRVARTLQIALFLAIVLLAVRASRASRRVARVVNAVVLAGSAVALALVQGTSTGAAAGAAAGAAFAWAALMLAFAVVLILGEVLSAKNVTLQSIFGAISAYLVIGLTFAAGYAAMSALGSDSFFANGQPATTATFQYFSFTTLTTVGYGDFTAAANSGRAVAVMEAVLGQVFLAVLVGWLVSAFRAPRFSGDGTEAAPPARTGARGARHNRTVMSTAVRRSGRRRSARPRAGPPARLTRGG